MTKTRSRSEMPVWTVSQKFSHLQWRRLYKELWSRPTTTADFGSSFRQIPCLNFERNQLCIYASLIRTIKTKKLVIVKHQNFLKPTSRIHPKERPTCFARQNAGQQKTAKPLLECHKMQISQQKFAKGTTL